MSCQSMATPCPVSYGLNAPLAFHSDETTTTFDFTSAIRPTLRNAKPRRPRGSVQFAIHEDIALGNESNSPTVSAQVKITNQKPTVRAERRDIQSQPRAIQNAGAEMTSTIHPLRSSRLSQAPKRPAGRLSVVAESVAQESVNTKQNNVPNTVKRPPRRGTIYIPSDDTTMPSMYMGIFSPIKNYEPRIAVLEDEVSLEMTGIAAQMAVKRGSRHSIMGVAPRRAPLGPSSMPVQEANVTVDRPGQGSGKENIPPCLEQCEKNMFDLRLDCIANADTGPTRVSKVADYAPRRSTHNPIAPSLRKTDIQASHAKPWNRAGLPGNSSQQAEQLKRNRREAHRQTLNTSASRVVIQPSKPKVPTRFVVPVIRPPTLLSRHVPLAENIANPSIYEENWLDHQEIVITQLVNNLFQSSRMDYTILDSHDVLRGQLLKTYGSDTMNILHKRLHAALLYGAIGIPQDVLNQGDSLHKDLGRKDRFVNLWLHTYDYTALQAALEVVSGRLIYAKEKRSSDSLSSARPALKKMLQSYIETCLLRNEDGQPDSQSTNRTTWSYQRTVLRSLMLVKVLDLIKTDVNANGLLFQASSTFKSSASVVQAIMQMLNPAAGDAIRALGHLDYNVSHVQYPLEEFDYTIDNLAVDLRDGTRLTRLVELLLYPSASKSLEIDHDPEATTTIVMPEGDKVDFQDGQDWPLSQHLKFPCMGKAPRTWNVQIALSAVQNVKGVSSLVEGVTADDIVNGYREKTIRLLWALVGKWGLTGLVDWGDVKWETRRLLHMSNVEYLNFDNTDEQEEEQYTAETCKILLQNWARAVAGAKGIEVRNFTTSFADGKAFEAIVSEYEPFLQHGNTGKKHKLDQRLINMGCSQQFAQLFATASNTHIFDRDFVLAALAFLCSRLLAPTKRVRAATVIQSAWRRHWIKIEARRKDEKRQIASACAALVKGKLAAEQKTDCQSIVDKKERPVQIRDIDLSLMSPMSASNDDIWLSL